MDWNAFYRIMDAARELPPEARRPYVLAACGEQETLLRAVQESLQAEVEDHFLEPPFHESPYFSGSGLTGIQLDQYRLLQEIARGGLGVVYLAAHVYDARQVAIKVLPPVDRQRVGVLPRFTRELELASQVSHPHVVPVLASGDNGRFAWYAMPRIPGHDLGEEIDVHRRGTGRHWLPTFGTPEYFTCVAEQVAAVAEGLHSIHEAGIIHRDIKPRNLLLSRDARLHIADFGLAQATTQEEDVQGWQGTPFYMSPEQAAGAGTALTPQTDVYSLGVVLYELLSLHRPFEGQSQKEVLERVRQGQAPKIETSAPRAPQALTAACARAMQTNPQDRFACAQAMATALRP